MARTPHQKHPGVETLHAFAAGEIPEGAIHTAIGGHLAHCAACASELRRVGALRDVFAVMSPPPFDDLRWARLARRVQAELRTPERTVRRDWLRWWAPAAVVVATAAAAVLVVSVWPRVPASVDPAGGPGDAHTEVAAAIPPDEDASPRVLRVAQSPIDVTLESGLRLRLGPSAEVRLLESGLERVELELESGELAVSSDGEGPEISLRAPDLVATARGRASFTVARLANAPTAFKVDRGEVKVARGTAPTPPRARAAPAVVSGPSGVAVESAAPAAPADPWEAALRAYESGQLEDAVEQAQAVLGSGTADAARTRRAWAMVCDAELALDRPARAASACEALLGLVDEAEARPLHFRVATLCRARLHDCARATPHYDRMIVVGSHALMDQDALLGRAECALEGGDLDAAARDLGFLSGQKLARQAAYDTLRARLQTARITRKEGDR